SDTIATFVPTNAFTSVDLPTFGRPRIVTKPERNGCASGGCGAEWSALGFIGRQRRAGPVPTSARTGAASRVRVRRCCRHHPVPAAIVAAPLFDVADRRAPRDAPPAIGELFELFAWRVVFVGDLADDLLEEVFHRDDAGGAAVLVDHDGHVELARLHRAQQVV